MIGFGGWRSATPLLVIFGVLLSCSASRFDGLTGGTRAPRLLRPSSGAFIFTANPTLTWQNPESVEDVVVDVCTDRDCSTIETTTNVRGTSAKIHFGGGIENIAGQDFEVPSARFWRVSTTGAYAAKSAIWMAVVAPTRNVDTSWGMASDPNADGSTESIVGEPGRGVLAAVSSIQVDTAVTSEDACVDVVLPNDIVKQDGVPNFGAAVALAGDVNGDGFPDVIAATASTGLSRGQAFLYSGNPSPTYLKPIPQEITVPGASPAYGTAVAGAGDLDGDGYSDVVVSDDVGFWVFWGSPEGPRNPTKLAEPSSEFHVIAGHADYDGDGLADFAVSNISNDNGTVVIYYGARDRQLGRRRTEVPRPDGVKGFGSALANVTDIDLDGKPELFVGAPLSSKGFLFRAAGDKPELLLTFDGKAKTGFGAAAAADFGSEKTFQNLWIVSTGSATEKGTATEWPTPDDVPAPEIWENYPSLKDVPGLFTGVISDLATGNTGVLVLEDGRGRFYREACSKDGTSGRLEQAIDAPNRLVVAQ